MAAKRLPAISILMAFMLVASFLSALLPQTISPKPVQAGTTQTEFTSSTTWHVPDGVTSVQVLVVGGGGGGGGTANLAYNSGGGGGAGGVSYSASYAVTPDTDITVTVGSYGSGGLSSNPGGDGGASAFGTLTAAGGGGGGDDGTGRNGGSGGGGGTKFTTEYNGGSGTSGQGNSGGRSFYQALGIHYAAGGGGGAGASGDEGSTSQGGNGGVGVYYGDIFGTSVGASGWFAGGGGGGAHDTGGSGGTGGGASGASGNGNGNSVTVANSGGGGGGAYCTGIGAKNGGNGGSGIVIIKFTTNDAPTIGTVALWTTVGSPSETTSMTPQVEYNIKVPVTDNDTLNDLVTVKATLYYDSDGSYSEGEVPTSGNTQTCAILTWTNGGSPSAWTIDPSSSTTWSIVTANCVEPTLSGTTGTFEFHFKPGKVATYTTGSAKWHIYVKATDSVSNTGTGNKQNLTMAWYGEIAVNTGTINWGEVTAGLDFAEGDPSEEAGISISYICNGAYNQQLKADTSWSGSPSGSATLNTGGTPGANEFSLKADDDGTLDAAVTVSDSYQTFDTGTITSESGNAETGNSLWLKLGTPFTKANYSGTIYYQIAQ